MQLDDFGTLYPDPVPHRKQVGRSHRHLPRIASVASFSLAYGVPPMATRAYHPTGVEYTWSETLDRAERLREVYTAAGYGPGHRIAILFHQRPEFVFHYYALNALGCSVVPLNPDFGRDELAYVVGHSEACLVIAIECRLAELGTVVQGLVQRPPVVPLESFPVDLLRPCAKAEGTIIVRKPPCSTPRARPGGPRAAS